jgi:chromosomal replication initiation ATPase DnaA
MSIHEAILPPPRPAHEYILEAVALRRENEALRRQIDRLNADIEALRRVPSKRPEPPAEPPRPTIPEVIDFVAEQTGIKRLFLTGPTMRGSPAVHQARFIGYWLARNLTARSLNEIGRHFGDRDHASARNGIIRIEAALTAVLDGSARPKQAELAASAARVEAAFIQAWEAKQG